ncbi:hypothetical protein WN944_025165 [Citrus x changshan-huyou]|uniref:SKP1-like protein n=1 Tax=Citrus x changshan-huyou TaxID=2935761 RepID=A0AAP0LQ77_9ROSI
MASSSSSSSCSSSSEKKITLKSSDGEALNVEKNVALEFEPAKGFLEDNSEEADDEAIVVPLPNVSAAVLSELIPYVKQRLELSAKPVQKKLIKAFDDQFTRHLSDDKLGELMLAANYLGVNYLLDVLCDVTADRIKNKSVEYVREFLGIQNDFTPEEEAELRAQCPWAFEGVDQD